MSVGTSPSKNNFCSNLFSANKKMISKQSNNSQFNFQILLSILLIFCSALSTIAGWNQRSKIASFFEIEPGSNCSFPCRFCKCRNNKNSRARIRPLLKSTKSRKSTKLRETSNLKIISFLKFSKSYYFAANKQVLFAKYKNTRWGADFRRKQRENSKLGRSRKKCCAAFRVSSNAFLSNTGFLPERRKHRPTWTDSKATSDTQTELLFEKLDN